MDFDSVVSSNYMVGHSVLSTPDLSPPSSLSSNDGSSFFSAVSFDESFSVAGVVSEHGPKSISFLDSTTTSPIQVTFPSLPAKPSSEKKAKPTIAPLQLKAPPRRPAPLPITDFILSSPISPRRPRKLQKSRPMSVIGPRSTITSPIDDCALSNLSRTPLLNVWKDQSRLARRATSHLPSTKASQRSRRNSLPSIPSATYLQIPREGVRRISSERLVKFRSPLESSRGRQVHRLRSPYPNRLVQNASTDALASLALTGELPASMDSSLLSMTSIGGAFIFPRFSLHSPSSRSGLKSTWDSDHDDDAGLSLNFAPSSRLPSALSLPSPTTKSRQGIRRRWTLASAITDEGISDEALMEQLENVRMKERMWQWEWRKGPTTPFSPIMVSGAQEDEAEAEVSLGSKFLHGLRGTSFSTSSLSATWQAARRALLVCRELVRTERHYLAGLYTLSAGETTTPPPPLMLTYLPALVQASKNMLESMEKNPSAQGVADAFLGLEQDLEAAFVGWCGVVGSFFVDEEVKREQPGSNTSGVTVSSESNIKRRVGSWGKKIHSIKSLSTDTSTSQALQDASRGEKKRRSRPSVRDLAILPTQRVMRYTLLYKDLYSHTPTASVSQSVVERAMIAALSIAEKCDRAQGNAAFLQPAPGVN